MILLKRFIFLIIIFLISAIPATGAETQEVQLFSHLFKSLPKTPVYILEYKHFLVERVYYPEIYPVLCGHNFFQGIPDDKRKESSDPTDQVVEARYLMFNESYGKAYSIVNKLISEKVSDELIGLYASVTEKHQGRLPAIQVLEKYYQKISDLPEYKTSQENQGKLFSLKLLKYFYEWTEYLAIRNLPVQVGFYDFCCYREKNSGNIDFLKLDLSKQKIEIPFDDFSSIYLLGITEILKKYEPDNPLLFLALGEGLAVAGVYVHLDFLFLKLHEESPMILNNNSFSIPHQVIYPQKSQRVRPLFYHSRKELTSLLEKGLSYSEYQKKADFLLSPGFNQWLGGIYLLLKNSVPVFMGIFQAALIGIFLLLLLLIRFFAKRDSERTFSMVWISAVFGIGHSILYFYCYPWYPSVNLSNLSILNRVLTGMAKFFVFGFNLGFFLQFFRLWGFFITPEIPLEILDNDVMIETIDNQHLQSLQKMLEKEKDSLETQEKLIYFSSLQYPKTSVLAKEELQKRLPEIYTLIFKIRPFQEMRERNLIKFLIAECKVEESFKKDAETYLQRFYEKWGEEDEDLVEFQKLWLGKGNE